MTGALRPDDQPGNAALASGSGAPARREGATGRSRIERWVDRNARPVDAALLAAQSGRGSLDDLVDELARFQNADGGFGHGLEADLRTPESSALATSVALQYLTGADTGAGERPIVRDALGYLRATFVEDERRWRPIAPSTNDHPAAPWWDYEASLGWTDWGNPSAELLGYLIQCSPGEADPGPLAALTERAVARLDEIGVPEFHELLCFGRLYGVAAVPLRARLWPRLSALIVDAVEPDPARWVGYGATPLTFVRSPTSPFLPLFEPSIVEADIERLQREIVGGDHWEPNFSWADGSDAWEAARREHAGMLTVRFAGILDRFGAL